MRGQTVVTAEEARPEARFNAPEDKVGSFARAAQYYDMLYADKDYAGEARFVAGAIRARCPEAVSLLDVGCGTAGHAPHFVADGFAVDGIELEPEFVALAAARCPAGVFHVGDMRSFELADRFDAVVSLFSAIGYARDENGLRAAIGRMASHVKPGGVVLVEPWFEPGALTHGWITTRTGQSGGASVCRMSRTRVDGRLSRLEFEYLVGTEAGIERLSEVHELGLFTPSQMASAFTEAGLSVERIDAAPGLRGLYVGQPVAG